MANEESTTEKANLNAEYQEWLDSHSYGRLGGHYSQLMSQLGRRHLQVLLPAEELKRAKETFIRASGDCLCPVCREQYRKHPTVVGVEWLNRLCNGEYVKL